LPISTAAGTSSPVSTVIAGAALEALANELLQDRLDDPARLRPITAAERDAAEDQGQKNKAKLLAPMAKRRGASLADLAQEVGWPTKDGKPYRSLVQRTLNALREDKLIKKESGRWVLTKAGLKEARMVSVEEDEIPDFKG